MPSALLLPTLLVIATFLLSGVGKLLDLGSAATTLRALHLPEIRPRATVGAVAALEIAVSATLAAGTNAAFTAGALGALAMTLVFLGVGLRAGARGSNDECGCFGRMASTRVGPGMTARNLALAVLAGMVFVGGLTAPPRLPLPVEDTGTTVALLVAAAAAAVIAGSLRRPAPTTRGNDIPDAALITPDQEVVVPRQRALRGRAQLLLFVRRGCSSCENLIDRMRWDRESLETLVDVRLIVPVGDDMSLGTADDGLHVDPSGEFAVALGIPGNRPVGVLLTTKGEVLQPIAVGGDETATLVDTVLAAAAEAHGPHTGDASATP